METKALQKMDVTSLKAVLSELRQTILPSRFETAQQPEPGTIQLGLRTLKGLTWLEISWHADAPRLVQISPPSRIGTESTLAKQIKYGLSQMALIEIKQNGFERIVEFCLASRPGSPIQKVLLIELMGRHSNLLLLDHQKKVITIGKQIRNHQSRIRPIGTGDTYSSPPTLEGIAPDSEEPFESWKNRLCLIPYSLKQALQKTYQGISPSLALQLANDEIDLARKFLELPVLEISPTHWHHLYKRWCQWVKAFETENLNIYLEGPTAFRAWSTKSALSDKNNSISLILGKYYREYLSTTKLNQLILDIQKKLSKLKETQEKYLSEQEYLLLKTPKSNALRKEADELLCLPSPSREVINKAQKLYRQAKKAKRSLPLIESRICYHKQRLESIQESTLFLDELRTNQWEDISKRLEGLIELKQELDELNKQSTNQNHKQSQNHLTSLKNQVSKPLTIKSPNGLEIQVGRNHRQNEWISFRKSRAGDIWFHVQECPGSHVILKASTGIAEEKDIQMAANLAAFFSKAKGNKRVPVLMVATNHLQRIPGAAPGAVQFRKSEICWGEPSKGMQHINT